MAREMKDSGIAWIGEIPTTWKVIKLKYLFSIIGGNGFPDALQGNVEGDYPFCKVSDINGTNDYVDTAANWVSLSTANENRFNIIPSGSILMAKIGAALAKNHRKINTIECCIDNNTQALVPKRDDNTRYLFYLSKCIDMRWFDNNSTVPSINNQKLLDFFVPDVPTVEQEHISTLLDAECARIDAVIEQTRASIEEYKKLKQAVITQAVTKGIRPNRSMKDSGIDWIGEIPNDWVKVNAHKIISSTQNGLTRRDLEQSVGQIVLKLKNISTDGSVDYSSINRIKLTNDELEKYSLTDGDFLFVRVNGSKSLVGKCSVFSSVQEPVAYNDHIIRVRLNEHIEKRYFQLYLLSNVGRIEIDLRTITSAGQFTISGEGLRDLNVLLPPIQEQRELIWFINDKFRKLDSLISKKELLLSELDAYKKSLIFEYVTGKKEVKNV